MKMSWDRLTRSRIFTEFVKKTPTADNYLTELRGIVSKVINDSEILLSRYLETYPEYTLHNSMHSVKVVELMGLIIPPETLEKLNPLELAMLILGAYLHDIGMVVNLEEKEQTLKDERFLSFKEEFPEICSSLKKALEKGEHRIATQLEDYLFSTYFRQLHHVRSRNHIISKYGNKKGMEYRGVNFANDVALLCESHCMPTYSLAEVTKREDVLVENFRRDKPLHDLQINLQYLAVCLRLADLLDFDRERTPAVLFKHINPKSKTSLEEWNKHLSITGWKIGIDEISYEAECTHPLYQHILFNFLDIIDDELFHCTHIVKDNRYKIVEKYKLLLPTRVDRRYITSKDFIYGPFQFSLDFDRVIELLMGSRLYSTISITNASSVAIRELLQNAIDACRHRQAIERTQGRKNYRPWIDFSESVDDDGTTTLTVEDNGVGMNKHVIENYFMKVGRSYYHTNEFQRERVEFKKRGGDFEPGAQFGIGIMSCFMIADQIKIDTLKTNIKRSDEIPQVVEIEGPSRFFVVRKGKKKEPGTKITLYLKESIPWKEWLKKYALHVKIPIKFAKRRSKISSKFDADLSVNYYSGLNHVVLNVLKFQKHLKPYKIDLSKNKSARAQELRGKINIHFLKDENDMPCFQNSTFRIFDTRIGLNIPYDDLRSQNEKMKRFYEIRKLERKIFEGSVNLKDLTELNLLNGNNYMNQNKPEVEIDDGISSCDGIRISDWSSLLDLRIPHTYDIDMSGTLRPEVNVTKDKFVENDKKKKFRQRLKEIIAEEILKDLKQNKFFPIGIALTEFLGKMNLKEPELVDRISSDPQLINQIFLYHVVYSGKPINLNLNEIISKHQGLIFGFEQKKIPKLFQNKLTISDFAFPNSLFLNVGELTVHTLKKIENSYIELNLLETVKSSQTDVKFANYVGHFSSALYVNNLAKAVNMNHNLIKVFNILKSRSPKNSLIVEELLDFFRKLRSVPSDINSEEFTSFLKRKRKILRKLKQELSKTQLLDSEQLQSIRINRKDFGRLQ